MPLPYSPAQKQYTFIWTTLPSVRMSAVVMLLVLYLCFLAITLADYVVPHSSLQKHQPLCHDHEKLALLRFKQSFFLDCAVANDPTSAYPKMKTWEEDDADCCRWNGVTCDWKTGHVSSLDLSFSCLYGSIPSNSTVFELDHLLELNLSGNNFNYSQIPPAIGRLSKLNSLNLSYSFLSGQIPSELSQLSTLSLLDLSSHPDINFECQSHLVLHDPSMEYLIRNFTHLALLDLTCVDISSPVPQLLSNMTSLIGLDLQKCNLFGQFPASILQLPNLEKIVLSFNGNLEGYLPEFPLHSAIKLLYVPLTQFSGELPPSIGRLGRLRTLQLGNCNFSGRIPSSLGNLTQLSYLDLGENAFESHIPTSLANLTELEYLDLSDITAEPEELNLWLPRLHKLTQLHLQGVNLGGEIPESLKNLTGLTKLDLSMNQLTGALPNWLANMTQLTSLTLLENQLQGHFPQWLPQLVNLEELYLQYNSSTMFDTFSKLKNLYALQLVGVSLRFSPATSANDTTVPNFYLLALESSNLTDFPQFLHSQNSLTYLSLSNNNIRGNIPQWFVKVAKESLSYLDLSFNFLTGFEEPPVFLTWTNLEYLKFTSNKFRGLLPSPPSTLQAYLVSHNQFYGVIPKQICNASSLSFLDLSNNNMSGEIPHCIGHLDSLLVLNLLGNDLSGKMPARFSKSCKMKMINLSKNRIEGPLPKSLTNCMLLQVLDMGENQINDTFPAWLGYLPKLQVLVLSHNKLHGNIASPKTDHVFRWLRIIDISHNFLDGGLPYSYIQNWEAMKISKEGRADASSSNDMLYFTVTASGYTITLAETLDYSITITNKGHETYYPKILTVFRMIDLSSNNFTGSIPNVIGNLKGLQALNLSNNNLDGELPSSLAEITDLESLDLSQNKLQGEIPHQLTELTSLAIFNVSHNRLIGPIPEGNQFNTFSDNSSFDGNFALCGFPLSKQCHHVDTLSSPSMQTSDGQEENSELIDWVVRVCGCISGLIVGFIVGKMYITDSYHDWFVESFARVKRH